MITSNNEHHMRNTEMIFQSRKSEISHKKEQYNTIEAKKPKKIFNGAIKKLSLQDNTFWETNIFKEELSSSKSEKIPKIEIKKWMQLSIQNNINYDITNNIIRTINEINYNSNAIELNLNITLSGQSSLYIFTRSFVNRDVNESDVFDNSSIYNESGIIFNKYTTAIIINKEECPNKSSISFATYCEDDNQELFFKVFAKRQLVDYDKKGSNKFCYNSDNSLPTHFNINLIDMGDENVDVKIYLNNNKFANSITGNFFLPINKRAKFMIGGCGDNVVINELLLSCFEKDKVSLYVSGERSCSCCYIH